jgi:chromosomal replication initiation ATPase DnaA
MKELRENMPTIKQILATAVSDIEVRTGLKLKLFLEPNDYASELVDQCCVIWDIDVADLREKARTRDIVLKRFVVCLLLHTKTTLTLADIGQRVGYADHSNVLYALEKAKDYIDVEDFYFMQDYNPVKHLLDEVQIEK